MTPLETTLQFTKIMLAVVFLGMFLRLSINVQDIKTKLYEQVKTVDIK